MQKLLTIVVPVYKVEPYINNCLDSCVLGDEKLMNQLEVIIVNDGTPDRSAEMSREYVKRYPNTFRQIDKENGGHGSAWNVGLKEASGKYLRFLDSDDWLTNLERLLVDLKDCDADVVFNRYSKHYVEEGKIVTSDLPVSLAINEIKPIDAEKWGMSHEGYNDFNFWTVTYKTSILKPLYPLFAEHVMYDDYIITWAPLVYGRSCMAFDYTLYNYLIGRPNQSMSVSKQEKKARSYWACFNKFEEIRAKIDEDIIPLDYKAAIDTSIQGYASFIFWYLVFLPFKESKSKMSYLEKKYLHGKKDSSVLRRYSKWPFVLFYLIEHLRYLKKYK